MTLTNLTARDFRCFHRVEARLAPLTLLVGENGAGKTSFLALARALLDSGYGFRIPDFREPPYDLGTFRDIARRQGSRGGAAASFSASFDALPRRDRKTAHRHEVTFVERAGRAVPSERRYASGGNAFIARESELAIETPRGRWSGAYPRYGARGSRGDSIPPQVALSELTAGGGAADAEWRRLRGEDGTESRPRRADFEAAREVARSFSAVWPSGRRYCNAPARTRPLETGDTGKPERDREGETLAAGLADEGMGELGRREELRDRLAAFGSSAGLFDEIRARRPPGSVGSPVQVQVRRNASRKKGPWRDLADAGCGVRRTLPLLTELYRRDGARIFLLRQPETHLHPRAQAEIGSLLCRVAASGRQVIVETHSDYLWDRVRMDARDGRTELRPKDVSLLFFERGDREVNIHSIEFDRVGAVIGAPVGYRQFFLDELNRSISV